MLEESKIVEILNRIDSLYTNFESTFEYIKTYNSKYDISESYSDEILNSERSKFYEPLLTNLAAKKFDEVSYLTAKLIEKLEKLRKLTLSEIAHKKSKEIEFQLDNPFFFRKLRKDYRRLINELDILDRSAPRNSTKDIDSFVLKSEKIIKHLIELECEIEDEKKSGMYNLIAKSAVWGMPIIIGLYQLVAMQYFTLNPYLPLVIYITSIFIIYLLLKSFTEIKFLYIYFKSHKSDSPIIFIYFIIIIFFVWISVDFAKEHVYLGSIPATYISIIPIIIITFYYCSFAKEIIEEYKNDLIQNELEDLAVKYGAKE